MYKIQPLESLFLELAQVEVGEVRADAFGYRLARKGSLDTVWYTTGNAGTCSLIFSRVRHETCYSVSKLTKTKVMCDLGSLEPIARLVQTRDSGGFVVDLKRSGPRDVTEVGKRYWQVRVA